MCDACWSTDEGLVTLDERGLRLRKLLDDCFVQIAFTLGAQAMQFPPLLRVEDVDALDYFVNFPQLPLVVSSTRAATLHKHRSEEPGVRWAAVDKACLDDGGNILPPAACYAVYIHNRGCCVGRLKSVTTLANCYRNETHYVGLKRLKGFSMREIVFIGEMAEVTGTLEKARKAIQVMCEFLMIPVEVKNASDPFFDPNSTRAVTQKLFPVKQELVFEDDLAIASANFHRNFFGERFNISSSIGNTAFTGCIGMGLERWLHALLSVHGDDIDRATEEVERFLATITDIPLGYAEANA